MKLKINAVVFLVVFLSLALIPISQGMNLGVVQKTKEVKIRPGETAEFSIIFWNRGEEAIKIQMEAENEPEDWVIVTKPREISLEKSGVKTKYKENVNYIKIPGVEGYIETEDVKVVVKTPESTKLGEYNIKLKVIAGNPNQGISIYQQRNFNLKVTVKKDRIIGKATKLSEPISNIFSEGGTKIKSRVTGLVSSANPGNYIGLIVIIMTICLIGGFLVIKVFK